MTTDTDTPIRFADLGLPDTLLRSLAAVGYEQPSPIQAATIPHLLAGRDLLGTAQTGTGKTAAFALPILARIDVNDRRTQALVLAPTRELAIQVAEAFQRYASQIPGFHVLPIYGGQGYGQQLAGLKRGAHVVVGTPGRVTRPTRCCAWASSTTSRRSCRRPPRSARWCCSRPPCRRRSGASRRPG
jgi:ATP-dependent RNA helicase DeaD